MTSADDANSSVVGKLLRGADPKKNRTREAD
jgi:hypothetical protein